MALRELHLFAGAGGGILGGILCGHISVCAVELEEYPRKVLVQRQRDGILPWFPIWDDVCTFDGTDWKGKVDVICGGFPCQDVSAGGKGAGLSGERSGLWSEMARITSEVRPRFVFVENSPLLVSRGLGVVLSDLAAMGYDATWGIVGGAQFNSSPILRERLWILASPNAKGWLRRRNGQAERVRRVLEPERLVSSLHDAWNGSEQDPLTKCQILGMADGVAGELDRIKALGNGQVPQVAALAWNILSGV